MRCPFWQTPFPIGYTITRAEFDRRQRQGSWPTDVHCLKCGRRHPVLDPYLSSHPERTPRQEARLEHRKVERDAPAKHMMRAGWLPRYLLTDEEIANPRKLISLREYLERTHPTRARAVLEYAAFAEQHWPGNSMPVNQQRGKEPGTADVRRRGGRPAEIAAEIQRRRSKARPDPAKKEMDRIVARVREVVREAPTSDGVAVGNLRIAAEYFAPQLQAGFGLTGGDAEMHRAFITEWLIGCWGEIVHAFPERPDLPGYFEWRERSRQKLAAL